MDTREVEDYRLTVLPRPEGWVTVAILDDGVLVIEDVDLSSND